MPIALGAMVAGYGVAGSYLSIAGLAHHHQAPLAGLVPVGIDGGLVAVVVLDLALTWVGSPVGWLRLLVRVSAGTVVTNAVAGWPDPVVTGLHAAARSRCSGYVAVAAGAAAHQPIWCGCGASTPPWGRCVHRSTRW